MKIRYVLLNAYAGGGTTRTTLTMAGALAERGHDVEVASVLQYREHPPFPVSPALRLRSLTGMRPDLTSGWRQPARTARWATRVALRKSASRVIHPGDARYASFTRATDLALARYLRQQHSAVVVGTRPGLNLAVARLTGPDVVRVAQEHVNFERARPGIPAAYREFFPRLDALVTLTERDATAFRGLLGDDLHIAAIPNAVPDIGGARAPSRPLDKVVIAAGRLTVQKGFDILVKAWEHVAASHPDWSLHIYGTGVDEGALRALVDELGLRDQVVLKGFTASLPQQMAASSLYVLSSRWEGFPMVLLEAMGVGLPVVAFDCPTGPAELVEDGVNGLLVPPKSIRGMGSALVRAIEDADLREAMGRAALDTARGYSRDAVAQQWEGLLVELAAQRRLSL